MNHVPLKIGDKNDELKGSHTFKDYNGGEAIIDILNAIKIGEGAEGEVYRVDALVENTNMIYALKNYRDEGSRLEEGGDRSIDKQLEIHSKLKKLNIPTWETFKKHKIKQQILLTYGNTSDVSLLSINEGGILNTNEVNKNRLNNLDQKTQLQPFLDQLEAIIYKANSINIAIGYHAYFMLYNKEKHTLSPLVGDLDNVEESQDNVFKSNVDQMDILFFRFLEQFTPKGKEQEWESQYNSWKTKLDQEVARDIN